MSHFRSSTEALNELVREVESLTRGRAEQLRRLTIAVPRGMATEDIRSGLAARLESRGWRGVSLNALTASGTLRVVAVEFERRAT